MKIDNLWKVDISLPDLSRGTSVVYFNSQLNIAESSWQVAV